MSRIRRFAALLCALTLLCCASCAPSARFQAVKPGGLRVVVLEVGKADAILLRTENHAVLIDAAYDDCEARVLEALRQHGVEKLDLLIITHFDKDHIGSADAVLSQVNVAAVLQPDYQEDSKDCERYAAALQREGITPESPDEPVAFTFDEVEILVEPPKRAVYDEDNDYSLVVRAHHGENRFLFPGDAMAERLGELLDEGDLAYGFLKVPHHGRLNERSSDFISAASPDYAVITCAQDAPVAEQILDLLAETGAEVYLTTGGDILCESDGASISVRQERPAETY